MPTSRIRDKSATSKKYITGTGCGGGGGGVGGSATSLLKIESVVPTLSRKPNKSIYRSYSTLNTSYFQKGIDGKADQRKSNGKNFGATHNGFWRIHRTSREKEKLPDRINLDRRGLTALPIIDNEPNLRLLSLQHNLINSFHVPANQKPSLVEEPSANLDEQTSKKSDHLQPITNTTNGQVQKSPQGRQLLTQRSMCSRNFSLSSNKCIPPSSPLGSQRSSNIAKNSFVQKSVLLHAKEKHIFRRANSFINNYSYSHHMGTSKAHFNHHMMKQNQMTTMSSLSSDSTSQETANNGKSLNKPSELKNESFLECTESLQNLVFLDLYDNQVEKISSLDGLKSLTVLLLGKNRITDISGIISVKKTLRVLDLHGNKITNISQKICQLQELKSLNLAGNCLKAIHADDFKGLFNLRELNLKRNKIKKIQGFDDLRSLERLWLCHNDLQKVEDMSCIAKSINLKEVTIENNPVSLGGDCVSFIVSYLPNLILLSQMQVTEQVRRAAMAWRKSKEMSDSNYSHLSSDVCQSIRREEVISNARTNWELLRTQQQVNKCSSFIQKSIRNSAQHLHVPVSEIEVDLFSNLTENSNNSTDRKLVKQKTLATRSDKKKNFKGKRSFSQENLPEAPLEEEPPPSDFFRLPPILAPFLDQSTPSIPRNNSSASSLGLNIDSSSSYISSDNEDGLKVSSKKENETNNEEDCSTSEHQNINNNSDNERSQITNDILDEILTNPPIDPQQELAVQKPPSPEKPQQDTPNHRGGESPSFTSTVVLQFGEEDNQSDKTSNLSSTSIQTISDSSSTANYSDDNSKSQKSKFVNSSNRKYISPSIRVPTITKNSSCLAATSPGSIGITQNQFQKIPKSTVNDREREQGGDYLIEICGRYLNVYGAGAIKFIDRQWNTQKANDVHTFKFSYVNFNCIATILCKIKSRFPNAENFVFRETNINSLGQLNALAEIQGIASLIIDPEGNLICTKHWRPYAIYRLSHWGIKTINETDVTEEEVEEAHKAYSGLSDLVLWSLPDSLLEPLLARLRLDENCTASKMTAKQWLMQADSSLKIVVGKEALQAKKSSIYLDECALRQRGRNYFSVMMENTCNAVEKLQKLETLWPNLLLEMVRNTLLDYSQIDVYVKNLMAEMNNNKTRLSD